MPVEAINCLLAVVGTLGTISTIVIVVTTIVLWAKGIAPALWRLGIGLARRKVAILAKGDRLESVYNVLADSKLFSTSNLLRIPDVGDLGRAEKASVFVVVWSDFGEHLDEILRSKKDSSAMLVYAPYVDGRIPDDQMALIDTSRNSTVTNFRGRLLNDVVTALITTSYEKG